jgi:hypothetical protein
LTTYADAPATFSRSDNWHTKAIAWQRKRGRISIRQLLVERYPVYKEGVKSLITYADVPATLAHDLDNESLWTRLYSMLLPKAKSWVYNSDVYVWRGQEHDVAWDIVQTAIARTLEYLNNAHKQGIIIHSLERLSIVIAKNHYRDRKRHEQRLQRFPSSEGETNEQALLKNLLDPSEEASEKVYEEWLLIHTAKYIATFSKKRREAILIDLANRMHFGADPTVLQEAFLALGIRLQDYQHSQPANPVERGRQAALRSLAYKSVAQMASNLNCPSR